MSLAKQTRRAYQLSPEWRAIQRTVFDRDHRRCYYCGRRASQLDHVMPRSRGGRDHPDNLVSACAECNRVAGDKPFYDATRKRDWVRQVRGLDDTPDAATSPQEDDHAE